MIRRALLAALALVALAPAVRAAPFNASPYVLSPEDKARVDAASAYLQRLATVQGKFTQEAPDGNVTTGQFFMARPGKARFAYDPPARMLIVSDGSNVSIYDERLKSFDRAPLSATPLNLLLAKEVRLDRGVHIGRVDRTSEGFAITAVDIAHQAEGRIVIYFSDKPLALRGWNVFDAQNRLTKVRLGDLTAKPNLDSALFVLHDPRQGR